MIVVEELSPGVISLDVTGRLEKTDIEHAITELEAAREAHEKISLVVDLTGFAGMTAEALIADLRYGFSQINELDHYQRIAVLTGHEWIETLIWLEGKVFRSLDIRCFKPDERQRARAFANGMQVPPAARKPAIVRVPTDRADMLAFRITDKVRTADAKAVMGFLSDAYQRHERIDLMVIVDEFEGFEPKMLFEGATWSTKGSSLSHVRRYAIVGGPAALRSTASFMGAFMPVEIKAFERDEEDAAWKWLNAGPLLAA
ncbi:MULTISPECIES: STAS/SEC14 domain-containing protein [unclassified Roseitalea]|uniref:STAS/SEC14 domain-containing protein n=1 Tax=unclassified Roseitalea TaxID=2639107 RepID=UPI00273E1C5E|nr:MULTISPECIES: STAS/SEC14 domain-containing protein [unclassified Roseitalea]